MEALSSKTSIADQPVPDMPNPLQGFTASSLAAAAAAAAAARAAVANLENNSSRLDHRAQIQVQFCNRLIQATSNRPIKSGGDDDPMSDNDLSRDGDESPDALSRIPAGDMDPETLEKLRRQEREEREEIEKELRAQSESLNLTCPASSDLSHSNSNTPTPQMTRPISPKEPLPLGLAGLEAFRREYLTSPLSHLRGGGGITPTSLMSHPFPPILPPVSAAAMASIAESSFRHSSLNHARPSSSGSATPPAGLGSGGSHRSPPSSVNRSPSSEFTSQQNWSFEEQFKQLYELSDDVKRKDFLDDLFAFMQKRGTPINRLPIMAKQVLDLYELYNLVTARGGLVEVINKKQWQEIIKGLNLPSSITSAAFTLRTQYTKYIYPYECHMKNLSSPSELQAAIDGNRREGRRSGYDSYPHPLFPPGPPVPHGHIRSPTVPLPPSSLPLPPQMSPLPPGLRPNTFNGNAAVAAAAAAAAAANFPGGLNSSGKKSPPLGLNPNNPLSALEMTRLALFKMYNQGSLPPPSLRDLPIPPAPSSLGIEVSRAMAEQQVRALQSSKHDDDNIKDTSEVDEDAGQHVKDKVSEHHNRNSNGKEGSEGRNESNKRLPDEADADEIGDDPEEPPVKRERRDSHEGKTNGSPVGGANIRISSRGESGDSSLVVSLEINSVMYQGVLFAQTDKSNNSKEKRQDTRIS